LLKVQKLSGLSRRELTALISALAILGISFSLRFFDRSTATWNSPESVTADLEIFLLILVVVGSAFLGHELAHKFTAQRYGCWAEFKLWTYGALMALLFAVVTAGNFVFAAPGAVYIASRAGYFGEGIDRKSNGIVSLMGPIVNIAGALVFGIALLVVTSLGLHDLTISGFRFLQAGIVINIWLGAFNMLPIFILDGQKVYTWNKQVWAAIAIPLWALTILIYASPPA
jgi:Zn-dependent protease